MGRDEVRSIGVGGLVFDGVEYGVLGGTGDCTGTDSMDFLIVEAGELSEGFIGDGAFDRAAFIEEDF